MVSNIEINFMEQNVMIEKLIISQLYQLPEHLIVAVSHYIAFLIKEQANQISKKPKKRTFGSAKVNINWHRILMHR